MMKTAPKTEYLTREHSRCFEICKRIFGILAEISDLFCIYSFLFVYFPRSFFKRDVSAFHLTSRSGDQSPRSQAGRSDRRQLSQSFAQISPVCWLVVAHTHDQVSARVSAA